MVRTTQKATKIQPKRATKEIKKTKVGTSKSVSTSSSNTLLKAKKAARTETEKRKTTKTPTKVKHVTSEKKKDKNDPKVQKIAAAALTKKNKQNVATVPDSTPSKTKGKKQATKNITSVLQTPTAKTTKPTTLGKKRTPSASTSSSVKDKKTSKTKTSTKKTNPSLVESAATKTKTKKLQQEPTLTAATLDESKDVQDTKHTKARAVSSKKAQLRLYNIAYAMQGLQKRKPGVLKKNLKQIAHMRAMNNNNKAKKAKSGRDQTDADINVDLDSLIGRIGPRIFKQGMSKVAVMSRMSIEKSTKNFLPEMNHVMTNIIKRIARGVYLNMLMNDNHSYKPNYGSVDKNKAAVAVGNKLSLNCKARVMTSHVENGLEDMGYQVHHPSYF